MPSSFWSGQAALGPSADLVAEPSPSPSPSANEDDVTYMRTLAGSRTHASTPSVLVHLHYYEDAGDMTPCELANKRTNLAFLIERAMLANSTANDNVFFHVTFNGDDLPSLHEFYTSINVTVPSRPSLFPTHRGNVQVERVDASSTDLCPRAAVIRKAMRVEKYGTRHFSHVLFLNDGARGPFFTASEVPPPSPPPSSPPSLPPSLPLPSTVVDGDASSSSAARATASGAAHAEKAAAATLAAAPAWLAPYMQAFAHDSRVAAVGTTLSCEFAAHLQSWAVMFRWDVTKLHLLSAYEATCGDVDKTAAIDLGEIGPHSTLLANGHAIASLFPSVPVLLQADAEQIVSARSTHAHAPRAQIPDPGALRTPAVHHTETHRRTVRAAGGQQYERAAADRRPDGVACEAERLPKPVGPAQRLRLHLERHRARERGLCQVWWRAVAQRALSRAVLVALGGDDAVSARRPRDELD